MSSPSSSSSSFDAVYADLLTLPAPLLPPGKAFNPALTDRISSLYLHPAVETALHLLNADLPSAHFLARHMQAAPAYEGMYLHGILHRIEGDYDNARAWYGDIAGSEVFGKVWGSKEEGVGFVGKVEALNKRREGDKEVLEGESLREIRTVVEWCVGRFGKGVFRDATRAWVQPDEELKKMGQDMVSGGKGHRDF